MSRKLELSFACGDYEITRPLMEGAVKADGIGAFDGGFQRDWLTCFYHADFQVQGHLEGTYFIAGFGLIGFRARLIARRDSFNARQ